MTNSGQNPIPDAGDGGGSNPNDRVEWSRNTILEFIEDYRSFRVLWDPNTKGYHIKQIKFEALKKLSRKYSTEVRIIRSKIKSLRSSFHREHGKVISGKRRGINYQPMWFAYEAIRFILDGESDNKWGSSGFHGTCIGATVADTVTLDIDANDKKVALQTGPIDDTHYATINAEDVKTEIHENGGMEDLKLNAQQVMFNRVIKRRKRRISKEPPGSQQQRTDSESDEFENSVCKINRQTSASASDEFGIFGEYVGITIRKLKTSNAQIVIKHLINNLLFDAEMGRYDYGMSTSGEPPRLYATAD